MTPEAARELFTRARVARLATVDATDAAVRPHLVPIVFVVSGSTIYSAVDRKPKRSNDLRRLANVEVNSSVSLLVDHYDDENWDALWWVRADGTGRVIDDAEAEHAIDLLVDRYRQHAQLRPPGPVLAVDVTRWSGWSADPEARGFVGGLGGLGGLAP
ncbi:MAG: pyridoxamine 5-phosphate oxidase-related,FMN-binding protein [Pseudonocardiales bacterium]|nr:pyridoxamine 5-phosphate oxidase-related,FMN-binding protein [Pseudonocardiales bacterium]